MPIAEWLKAALDFCFPGCCAACQSECDGGSPLCGKCLMQLDALAAAPACGLCAAPVAYHDAPCPHCGGQGAALFDRVVSLGLYDEPVKSLIHAIKYHGAWPLAEYLAEYLMEQERASKLLAETDVLVALPLHPARHLSRGYNQAALITARIHRRHRIAQSTALVRVKDTETQTMLHSRTRREENLKDAFALRLPRDIQGKRVLLVDDVRTTGATLRSAARELRKGKPSSLSAIVVAVADPRGRHFQSV